jgi:hypothetical protein
MADRRKSYPLTRLVRILSGGFALLAFALLVLGLTSSDGTWTEVVAATLASLIFGYAALTGNSPAIFESRRRTIATVKRGASKPVGEGRLRVVVRVNSIRTAVLLSQPPFAIQMA